MPRQMAKLNGLGFSKGGLHRKRWYLKICRVVNGLDLIKRSAKLLGRLSVQGSGSFVKLQGEADRPGQGGRLASLLHKP